MKKYFALITLAISVISMTGVYIYNKYANEEYNITKYSMAFVICIIYIVLFHLVMSLWLKSIKIINLMLLLYCLILFPTINSNAEVECETEGINRVKFEDPISSNRKYLTITPFSYSIVSLFNEPTCHKIMDNYEPKDQYSISNVAKNINRSQMYQIHLISILFNFLIIFFLIRIFINPVKTK